MSCGPGSADRAYRRAEIERMKQHQRQLWTAAVTGAVAGAVNGARGAPVPGRLRIGDAERESALSALSEHYVAGRLTKEEFDERADATWAARTSGDLAPLFSDLPQLPPPPPPPRTPRRQSPHWQRRARLSWILVLLMVLAVTGHVPWFGLAIFMGLWWSGALAGLHRWGQRHR